MRPLLLVVLLVVTGACRAAERPEPPVLGAAALEGKSARGRYLFTLTPRPERPGVGSLFSVVTEVRDALTGDVVEDARFTLDATMPEHGHGMMTRPVHRELGGGRYLSEGMKLHMHGRWELVATLALEGYADELRLPVALPPRQEP